MTRLHYKDEPATCPICGALKQGRLNRGYVEGTWSYPLDDEAATFVSFECRSQLEHVELWSLGKSHRKGWVWKDACPRAEIIIEAMRHSGRLDIGWPEALRYELDRLEKEDE